MDYLCGCAYRSDGGERGGGTIHKPKLLEILYIHKRTATKTVAKKHDDTTESLLHEHAVTL